MLVVDDEPHIGLIVRTRLEQGPFDVVLAGDATEAFARLAQHPDVALVILDLMLPGMPGLEILARLRTDPLWHSVPCLVLTAAGQEVQLREAEVLGVSGVMTKPFSPRRLFERVQTLLKADATPPRISTAIRPPRYPPERACPVGT